MQNTRRPLAVPGQKLAPVLAAAMFLFVLPAAGQDGGIDPSNIWFRAYTLLQEGIKSEEAGNQLDALAKYNQAKPLFDDLARSYPEFHPQLVEYRRTQLVQKVGKLKDQLRNAGQAQNPANFAGQNTPAQPDPGPGGQPMPSVQPISPEFAPPAGQGSGGGVQLPHWDNSTPVQNQGLAATPTVVRPPADANTPNSSRPQSPNPYWGPQSPNVVTGATGGGELTAFERIQQDYERMRRQIESLQERNQQLESQLAQRQNELYDAEARRAESEKRTAALRQQLANAEKGVGSNPDMKAEVTKLKSLLSDALDELEKKDQENKELAAQLKATQNEMERLRQERDDIEKERNNLMAIMEGGSETSTVSQLMTENRKLRNQLKEVEKAARDLRKDNEDKTYEVALLKEQIEHIKSQREKLLADNRRYEGHILELRERLKELGQEVTDEEMGNLVNLTPEVAAEKELLLNVVMKQLARQTQVKRTKELLLRELDKLGADAENLYAMVEDIAYGPALSKEERELIKSPKMVEIVEAAGVEKVDGIILVEGAESDGSGVGIVATQNLDEELEQMQKAARLDYTEGRYEEAEKSYLKYLEFRPKSVICLCNLALVKMATRDHKEANELLERAVAIKSDYGLAYYLMGRNFYAQGEYDLALDRLNQSIQFDPKNARAHNCVGVISSQKGYVRRAEYSFSEAVKIDPKFGDAHYNLAVLYATMDKPNAVAADEHYQKAIDLGVPRDNAIEHYLEAARLSANSVSMR